MNQVIEMNKNYVHMVQVDSCTSMLHIPEKIQNDDPSRKFLADSGVSKETIDSFEKGLKNRMVN